jgi:hypothetical protein
VQGGVFSRPSGSFQHPLARSIQDWTSILCRQIHALIGSRSQTNMKLILLPPYSPEINPAEHIWDALREGCIGNTVFASLEAADKALCVGLKSLEEDHARMKSLTGFKWITSISLNAK